MVRPRAVTSSSTTRSGSATPGTGRMNAACTTENNAALAPMPSARDSSATRVKPRVRARLRTDSLTSVPRPSTARQSPFIGDVICLCVDDARAPIVSVRGGRSGRPGLDLSYIVEAARGRTGQDLPLRASTACMVMNRTRCLRPMSRPRSRTSARSVSHPGASNVSRTKEAGAPNDHRAGRRRGSCRERVMGTDRHPRRRDQGRPASGEGGDCRGPDRGGRREAAEQEDGAALRRAERARRRGGVPARQGRRRESAEHRRRNALALRRRAPRSRRRQPAARARRQPERADHRRPDAAADGDRVCAPRLHPGAARQGRGRPRHAAERPDAAPHDRVGRAAGGGRALREPGRRRECGGEERPDAAARRVHRRERRHGGRHARPRGRSQHARRVRLDAAGSGRCASASRRW